MSLYIPNTNEPLHKYKVFAIEQFNILKSKKKTPAKNNLYIIPEELEKQIIMSRTNQSEMSSYKYKRFAFIEMYTKMPMTLDYSAVAFIVLGGKMVDKK